MWFVLLEYLTIEEHLTDVVSFLLRMLNFNLHDKMLLEHQKLVYERANNKRNKKISKDSLTCRERTVNETSERAYTGIFMK